MKEYDINGRTFVQKPLVMGQYKQLLQILDGIVLPEQLTLASLLDALGGRLYAAIAVAITEKGCSPRDKDIGALAAELEWSADADTVLRVVDDFFALNPVSSIYEKIGGLIGQFNRNLLAVLAAGSTKRSFSLPGATSPGATPSSGDTP